MGKLFPLKQKLLWADSFSRKLCGSKLLINRSNDLYAGMIIILPKEVMMSYEDREFENTTLMVSASWHDILSSSYGEDYMTPKQMTGNEKKTHNLARSTK